MNNPTQLDMTPPYSWLEAMMMILRAPTLATMQQILKDDTLTPQRAYFWVMVGGIFLGIALAGVQPPAQLTNSMLIGFPSAVVATDYAPSVIIYMLLGINIGAITGVVGFIMQTWLLQRIGEYFAVQSNYRDMFVLRGIYYPVLLAIRALIVAILGVDTIATNILIVGTLVVDFTLSAMALSAANNLTWRQGFLIVAGMNVSLFVGFLILFGFGAIIG